MTLSAMCNASTLAYHSSGLFCGCPFATKRHDKHKGINHGERHRAKNICVLVVPLWLICFLKNELGAELNVARIVALRRHETESRVRCCCRAGIQAHSRSEVRVIECIQRLGTKLDPAPFTPLEILREPKVRS